MPTPPLTHEQVLEAREAVKRHGTIQAAADALGLDRRTLSHRVNYKGPVSSRGPKPPSPPPIPGRKELDLINGVILIGSDAHYHPGEPSTAHRAFVQFCKKLKPAIVIMNGDMLDAATISQHPPLDWNKLPSVKEELDIVQERLGEIAKATRHCKKLWPCGNHDARWEKRLASVAPEFKDVPGVSLADHFPDWTPCWSVFVNDDLVVKHRQKGGLHAPSNNALWAGRTMITGHLHAQTVREITDYNGTRYGVDTGCMADIYGPQFAYMEDGFRNWRSGFCVVTYRDGRLLRPELVSVVEPGAIQFRGEVIDV